MALIGRLHPLLVHFPIGLVLVAAMAEVAAMTTGLWHWRAVAVANVRVGAVFGIGAAIAGWLLASSPGLAAMSSLEWHRWLGTIAAVAVFEISIEKTIVIIIRPKRTRRGWSPHTFSVSRMTSSSSFVLVIAFARKKPLIISQTTLLEKVLA